jgi:riboflavin biosynthesis pyrimidine reductase
MSELIQLFPTPQRQLALEGLYLKEQLHQCGSEDGAFIYANFVSSLDGRIALKGAGLEDSFMPEGMSNRNDFRLFLELQAQADCLITHGGYLRVLAREQLGNVLQVGVQAGAADLPDWRKRQGLKPQPDIVIASASLDFSLPEVLHEQGQSIIIATGEKADPARIRFWESEGCRVIIAGNDRLVEGDMLTQELETLGYRSIYLVAGPQMLETMIRHNRLGRLYLTQRHRLFGGKDFHSMIPGSELGKTGHLRLRSLYYDSSSEEDGGAQLFASYDL